MQFSKHQRVKINIYAGGESVYGRVIRAISYNNEYNMYVYLVQLENGKFVNIPSYSLEARDRVEYDGNTLVKWEDCLWQPKL